MVGLPEVLSKGTSRASRSTSGAAIGTTTGTGNTRVNIRTRATGTARSKYKRFYHWTTRSNLLTELLLELLEVTY